MGSEASSFVEKVMLRQAKASAWKEVRWYYEAMGGCLPTKGDVPEEKYVAARRIRGWVRKLLTFHQGAFELRYAQRARPAMIVARFGELSGLVVRLECALHPSDGRASTEALEKASMGRLDAMLAGRRHVVLLHDLEHRAYWHLRAAHRAYVRVRGLRPCVLPEAIARRVPAEREE